MFFSEQLGAVQDVPQDTDEVEEVAFYFLVELIVFVLAYFLAGLEVLRDPLEKTNGLCGVVNLTGMLIHLGGSAFRWTAAADSIF